MKTHFDVEVKGNSEMAYQLSKNSFFGEFLDKGTDRKKMM